MANIFIVEDDQSLQNLYKLILQTRSYEIAAVANDGNEAIEIYKKFSERPDLIIVDYRMPLKNGLDTMREIKQLDNDQKFIFASADATIKEQAMDLGASGFLEKPFKMIELLILVENILNGSVKRESEIIGR